jgi:3-isopropylmalate/(R)-2-methylmalate dehydratase small subunit
MGELIMGFIIEGRAFKLGDDINTDYFIPGKYVDVYEPEELASHALEGLGEEYPKLLKGHSVVVAGENCGMGSAREQAPNALKGAGVKAIIAKSFARIFYRNTLNVGIAAIECPEAVEAIGQGDEVRIDLERGAIDLKGLTFRFEPFSDQIRNILQAGDMVSFLKKELQSPR